MNENEFLLKLQKRAKEQETLVHNVPFPTFFKTVGIWFGNHPWRTMIPFALLISFLLHLILGRFYDDIILKLFGGFGIIKL